MYKMQLNEYTIICCTKTDASFQSKISYLNQQTFQSKYIIKKFLLSIDLMKYVLNMNFFELQTIKNIIVEWTHISSVTVWMTMSQYGIANAFTTCNE